MNEENLENIDTSTDGYVAEEAEAETQPAVEPAADVADIADTSETQAHSIAVDEQGTSQTATTQTAVRQVDIPDEGTPPSVDQYTLNVLLFKAGFLPRLLVSSKQTRAALYRAQAEAERLKALHGFGAVRV